MQIEVHTVESERIEEPLALLSGSLRDGEPLPERFIRNMKSAVERGDIVVVEASAGGRSIGVAVLSLRLSIALGGEFASIEDLYVSSEYRGNGVGRAMISTAENLCFVKGISYVEVQIEDGDGGAEGFYSSVGYGREEGVRVMSHSQALGGSSESSSTS